VSVVANIVLSYTNSYLMIMGLAVEGRPTVSIY
jgi:hypothetical protein